MNGPSLDAILLGEQSLLIQCGELLLTQGWSIKAVVSCDSAVADWCGQKQVKVYGRFEELREDFSQRSVDYVFSITNLRLLPEWVLALGKKAINFHDGPLPRYAGLNAPVWAIVNNEQEHGVSWHEMVAGVDEGSILSQQTFPIVPGETALSINAKCYQAGIESFSALVEKLVSGNAQPLEQNLSERSYFGLTKRPKAAGLIDWCDPIEEIERLVRALDHGTYANPLVTAKLIIGDELVAVKSAQIVQRTTDQHPGTIVETHTNFLKVAVNGGVIELSDFWSLSGESYPCVQGLMNKHGLSLGSVLPEIEAATREQISKRLEETCRYENSWLDALKNAEAISIPYASKIPSDAQSEGQETWSNASYALPASALSSDAFQQSPKAYKVALLSVLLARLNNKSDFTFSVCAEENQASAPFFAAYLPLPVNIDDRSNLATLLSNTEETLVKHEKRGTYASDVWLRDPALKGHGKLETFGVKLVFGDAPNEAALSRLSNTELLVCVGDQGSDLSLHYRRDVLSAEAVKQLCAQLNAVATDVSMNPERAIRDISILSEQDLASTNTWNATQQEYNADQCLHHLIEQQALAAPSSTAVAFENEEIDYQGLNARANQVARLLLERGAKSGDLVGLMMDRSIDMVVTLIAIHKVGCAYVPLDPVYPADRLRYMVEDSKLSTLVTESRHKTKLGELDAQLIVHDELDSAFNAYSTENLEQSVVSSNLAYVIYTSGSTGKPKGVMVEHRNVVNFFVGMDQCIGTEKGTWLAVTSISFDISVLELFWTLSRGFKVVLYSDKNVKGEQAEQKTAPLGLDIDFSLFYWNVADEESHHQPNKYDLLLDGARFADQNGFKAVWNPERHFASFGGLFPNPAVTLAALSTITKNVDLRAGSCVIPLHSPIRVAEEWAVVDNLSNGRVGIAVASGWAPPDFAIKPENYADAKNIMFESLATVRRLWRGEKVTFPGPTGDVEVRTLPRPIQDDLPHWVTTAGNVDTFRRAGEAGSNVLTHLLGQTFEEVKEKVDAYREAWKAAGHPGEGTITLMLHTFIGEDLEQVKEAVRGPMKNYLKSAMFLVKGAAWNFPTFKKMSEETGKSLDEFFETISDEDMDDLLEFAFQRYFHTSGLFGTPETAKETVAKCHEIGVNEIACLIDYGIDTDVVLKHLPYLNELKNNATGKADIVPVESSGDFTIPALIERHDVTHFQCTPSMATMLVSDPESKTSLKRIQHMMVGGEALPSSLGDALTDAIGGRLTNMYGPTETTIWSSTFDVQNGKEISIGRPISNTQIYIVDQNLKPLPVGVAGELVIGGDGVVRGYHERPELTAERFVESFKQTPDSEAERVYRTGDLAKYADDGRLIYLGRIDHQVKIRGYRIELGEIESLLQSHESVRECAVILREDKVGDKRLVAYVRPHFEQHVDAEILKQHLAEQLPEFMVPAYYVELASMPLTPNGKLDRNALPEPIQQRHEGSEEFALPENEWESLIAEIWKQALGVPEVGRKDNFFDIGGHSLLVIQVLKDLREHDKITKSIQMTDLFRHTTIEALAKFVASDEDDAKATEAASSRVAARKAAMNRRRRR